MNLWPLSSSWGCSLRNLTDNVLNNSWWTSDVGNIHAYEISFCRPHSWVLFTLIFLDCIDTCVIGWCALHLYEYIISLAHAMCTSGKPSMQRTEELVAEVAASYPHVTVVSRRHREQREWRILWKIWEHKWIPRIDINKSCTGNHEEP